jgi:hypothetical protein
MDIGATLTAHLTDGRSIGGRLSFGDVTRAEIETKTNFMRKLQEQDDVSLTDLAVLSYQMARRVANITESFDEWLMLLDTFDVDVEEDATEEAVPVPFPSEAVGGC